MSVEINKKTVEAIDFHIHTFPDKIAEGAVSKLQRISGLSPFTNGTLADTIEKVRKTPIDRFVLMNIATLPKQQTTINNVAAKVNADFGGKIISFGSVHFEAEDCLSELERIKSLGIKGIKLHPDYQGFMIDDERLFPIYEKCSELGLPIVFHSGWDYYSPDLVHAPPKRSAETAKRFPKLKMILAHFGGLKMWDEVEENLVGIENIFFDTAMCASYADTQQIERMIKAHGEDRVLLGSDCPWENPGKSVDFILKMDLPDSAKEKILSGNAKRLLEIE